MGTFGSTFGDSLVHNASVSQQNNTVPNSSILTESSDYFITEDGLYFQLEFQSTLLMENNQIMLTENGLYFEQENMATILTENGLVLSLENNKPILQTI